MRRYDRVVDVLQSVGLEYAKHQTVEYGVPLAILILVGCALYKVHENGGSTAGYVVVAVITLVGLVQVPAAIQSAKTECRKELTGPIPNHPAKAQECREQFPELAPPPF